MGYGVNFRDALGGVLIAAFISVIGILLYRDIPKANEQLIVYMLGQLSGFVAGVVAYHYVTKAGEKELAQTRSENTGKALDLAVAATTGTPAAGPVEDIALHDSDRPDDDSVHRTEEPTP